MFRRSLITLLAIAFSAGTAWAAAPAGMQLPPQPKIRPAGIPANYMLVSPCIRGMGDHWADLKDMNAPIYGTDGKHVIFSEIMVPLKTLDSGFDYPALSGLPGHSINHVAIEFHPKGHEGMPVPHYDIHAYFITPAARKAICPNGIPDPDAAADMKM